MICTTFLKVDFSTENQLRVKDPSKHPTWNVLAKLWLKLFLFFIKIIHRRRLTES